MAEKRPAPDLFPRKEGVIFVHLQQANDEGTKSFVSTARIKYTFDVKEAMCIN